MSSTVRAQFWLWLPTRRISPLRTYQTVPSTSRTRVTRRPTASTVPIASPRSTASPTPYWSSIIIITPERKSLTRFWAPKPMARPSTPALARMGATFMPTSESTITKAMPKTTVVVMLLSRVPRLLARWARRLKALRAPSGAACGTLDHAVDGLAGEPANDDGADDDHQDRQRLADQPGGGRGPGSRCRRSSRRPRRRSSCRSSGTWRACRTGPGSEMSEKACEGGYEGSGEADQANTGYPSCVFTHDSTRRLVPSGADHC